MVVAVMLPMMLRTILVTTTKQDPIAQKPLSVSE